MMGVEPPKGPRHSGPRSNHAAVDIYSQSTQPLPLNGITNDLTVDLHQCLKGLVCEPFQPSGHTSLPRQTQQAAKPLDQGIFTEIYELIRRRARLIVACDGTADLEFGFSDFITLLARIETDFGARITFNPTSGLEVF